MFDMEIPVVGAWWPVVVSGLALLIYLALTWNYNYWKKRGVPYADPVPLFGNIKESLLAKKSMIQVLQDLYRKFEGHKFVGIFTPNPALLIRDPDLIKEILVKEFSSFHDNGLVIFQDADPLFGRNPFVLKGESWKVTRGRLVPAFTASRLKTLFPLIPQVAGELKDLLRNNDCSGEFEVKDLSVRFTTDVVTLCGYGINGNSIKNPKSEFREEGSVLFDAGTINTIKLAFASLFPNIAKLMTMRFISKRAEMFFRRVVGEAITYRTQKNVTRNDYLQHLINIKNKANENSETAPEKHPFTDIDVVAQATTFFLDGSETSSIAFSFVLYTLATNPEVQNKLRNEVNSVMKEDGGELTYEGIQRMNYLAMVLSETLRLYTPLGILTKVCTNPMILETPSGRKYTTEKGVTLQIPLSAIHRDPKYYPDPDIFNPENFSEENKKNRHKYAFMPFGEGPRVCLGRRFAVMQIKAGIASIVSSFEISTTSRTQIPIVQDPASFLLAAKGGIWLKFNPLDDGVSS